jgi:hypothetical protein
MVNTTDICRIAISIGILMTLSSSVPQTTRKKVYIETVYADRVENVYGDWAGKVHGDRFEKVYIDRNGQPIYCGPGGDCIRPCGGATCAVLVFPQKQRTAQPAQGRPETPRPSPK